MLKVPPDVGDEIQRRAARLAVTMGAVARYFVREAIRDGAEISPSVSAAGSDRRSVRLRLLPAEYLALDGMATDAGLEPYAAAVAIVTAGARHP